MDFKSVQKYLIKSPRKLREVVPLIKNLSPVDAVERLPFIKNTGSLEFKKVISAAIAQARLKGINDTDLKFKEIQVNEGSRLKRFRAGSRGRAKPYKKRMSHIRVILTTLKPVSEKKLESKSVQKVVESTESKKKSKLSMPSVIKKLSGKKGAK